MTLLQSARLTLDAPDETDIDAVFHACQDPEILRWIPLPNPYTRADAEFFVRSYVPHGSASGSYSVWALRREGDPLLGIVEVRRDEAPDSASLGCWLASDARGHGYMREALRVVVAYALDPAGLDLMRLRWETLAGNASSIRLAESVGFAFDPADAREVVFNGERTPAVVGILRRG